MTKSVRTVTFKDLNKFLTIYKYNTNTNRCFILTMVNLPQIIPKCSPNIMILIHGQPHDAQHKALEAMNLRLVNHLHQFSLLRPYEIQPHKKQYKEEERMSVMKGIRRQKKQRNKLTYGVRDPFYITLRYQNTWTKIRKAKQ